MEKAQSLAAPLGRVLISLIFIVSGIGKIANYGGTQGYMEAMGVPGMLLPAVIALELIGGIAIILGWKARVAAFLLANLDRVSVLGFSDQMQTIMFMKNLALAGGFLFIVAHGAGAWSVDNGGGR